MHPLLRKLSTQDQKLYSVILLACVSAFLVGLLGGLISFSSSKGDKSDNWQATILAPTPDTVIEFASINSETRWFREGAAGVAQAAEEAKKAIEGQPESVKIIGIVERSGRRYVLFLPVGSTGTQSVTQSAVGDTLVGDWKIKEIAASKVTVEAMKEGSEPQTREILLYGAKK